LPVWQELIVIIVEIINLFRKKTAATKISGPVAFLRPYHIIFKKKYINVTRQRGKEFFKKAKK
jgi:hypothetical protein